MSDEKKLDLIGRGVYIGSRWSKQNTIAELENIKARLNHRANEHLDGDYYVRIKDINEVIDEELAKLKGENNG